MPRLLIVSPHFPPVNAPDEHRVRMSLPYFVRSGWEVTVLTVDDPTPLAPLDPELSATVPADVQVVRARAWSRRWTGKLGVHNLGWRALWHLHREGCRLLRERRYDVVYFSTTQFITLPLGRLWRSRFGVPYVIDLQDPWQSDYYERTGVKPPGGWKYKVARLLAGTLEGWTLRHCSHVISVSPDYLTALQRRYAWVGPESGTTITFGAPEHDFSLVERRKLSGRTILPTHDGPSIAYAGRLGPDMIPALDLLFAAVATARRRGGPVCRLFFFGTSYAGAGAGVGTTSALARNHGIEDLVSESTDRIPYLDALQLLNETDIALILGSNETAYSPSKIYPTLLAGRPTLALAPSGSELERRLREVGGASIFGSDSVSPARVEALAEILAQLSTEDRGATDKGWSRETFLSRYGADALAARQGEILLRVIQANR